MLYSIIIFILLYLFEIGYLRIAKEKGIIDKPNYRSAHTNPTIRGGGIIFLPALLLFMFFYREHIQEYLPLIIAVFLVAIVSFIDDIKPLSTKIRITVHFIAFTLIFYHLGFFNSITVISLVILILSYVFSLGYLNIYNFMDGLNGMTFLNALVTFGSFLFINNYVVSFTNSNLLLVYILATLVFGFFNFRIKPKCFLGDVGSISIGLSIIYFIVQLFLETENYFIFLLLGVYLIDGGWTIVERLLRRENIFEAHRRHLYQQFANELKVPHLTVSIGYFIIQLIFNFIVFYTLNISFTNIYILIILSGILSLLYFYLKFSIYKKLENLT